MMEISINDLLYIKLIYRDLIEYIEHKIISVVPDNYTCILFQYVLIFCMMTNYTQKLRKTKEVRYLVEVYQT